MDLETLKKKKKEKRMTLKQISDISGVPKRTVDDIFCGNTKNPRIDTVQAIEHALGLNTITEEERAAGAVDSAKISVNADQMAWLDIYDRIVEKRGKETAAAFIEAFRNMLDL